MYTKTKTKTRTTKMRWSYRFADGYESAWLVVAAAKWGLGEGSTGCVILVGEVMDPNAVTACFLKMTMRSFTLCISSLVFLAVCTSHAFNTSALYIFPSPVHCL